MRSPLAPYVGIRIVGQLRSFVARCSFLPKDGCFVKRGEGGLVSDHMQVHHRFTGGKRTYLVPTRLFILPVPIQRGRPPTGRSRPNTEPGVTTVTPPPAPLTQFWLSTHQKRDSFQMDAKCLALTFAVVPHVLQAVCGETSSILLLIAVFPSDFALCCTLKRRGNCFRSFALLVLESNT